MKRFPMVLCALLISHGGFAQQTLGARVDDATISARVKTALIQDEVVKARQIDVETQNGVVQLSGFVDSDAARSEAEATARSIAGVTQVHNELIVRTAERTPGTVIDDSIIAAKVKSEVAGEEGLGTASAVNVEVNHGVVQLSGFVDSEEERTRAENAARRIAGVADVQNDIAVER